MVNPTDNSNSIQKILTIARNTFCESIRDRILYNPVLLIIMGYSYTNYTESDII